MRLHPQHPNLLAERRLHQPEPPLRVHLAYSGFLRLLRFWGPCNVPLYVHTPYNCCTGLCSSLLVGGSLGKNVHYKRSARVSKRTSRISDRVSQLRQVVVAGFLGLSHSLLMCPSSLFQSYFGFSTNERYILTRNFYKAEGPYNQN